MASGSSLELCPASNGWLNEFLCLALGQSQYAVPIPTSKGCCKRGILQYRLSFYSVSRFDEDTKSVSFAPRHKPEIQQPFSSCQGRSQYIFKQKKETGGHQKNTAAVARFHQNLGGPSCLPSHGKPLFTENDAGLINRSSSPLASSFQWFDNITFEINDTLLHSAIADKPPLKYHAHLNTHEILNSTAYYDFEKGLITEQRCLEEISHTFDLPEEDVRGLMQAVTSMAPKQEMLALVKGLQQDHKVFGVGNIPEPVFQSLCFEFKLLNTLELVFLSSRVGERMPHLGFFDSLLDLESLNPARTLFVSSSLDSVVAARSLGFYGLVFIDIHKKVEHVQAIWSDPIPRAQQYLQNNARQLDLEMANGKTIKDAVAQFLILDATEDESLVEYDDTLPEFAWSYGNTPKMFVYPPDIDINAIGMSAIKTIPQETRDSMMDRMLRYRNSYLTDNRICVCATAALNTITFFNEFGRGHQVKETEDWIYCIMKTRDFRDGTRYYRIADFFPSFCSRLIMKAPHLHKRLQPVLRDCTLERTEAPGDALSLACRVIASARCGISSRKHFERLLMTQEEDGSFGAGLCYRFARGGLDFYHRGLTASLAILAIKEWDQLRS